MKSTRRIQTNGSELPGHERSATGFTLIELVVVLTIIGILSALAVGAGRIAVTSGNKAREINAARNLAAAFLASAVDGDGNFLPGMDMRVNASTNPVRKPNGQNVTNVRAAQRYPFRIAPYLGNSFDGTILVNKNVAKIQQIAGSSGANYDYYVSTYPALGMNIYGVGGVVLRDGSVFLGEDCITTPARLRGSILAFASAGSGRGSDKIDGYCYVTPPTFSNDSPVCKKWGNSNAWSSTVDPVDYGNVDFRYRGQAVCAFLDGSVRMCSVKELNDMRLWSANAAGQDNASYTLSP